ncbi:MAG: sensor histidine kinase, partial [Anaerolineae bacterium]|nr:sensor histidine kinase [Anaerolineae bacterium]MCB0239429.1 sensor histidine kinase [Anaerolineae bacterium]
SGSVGGTGLGLSICGGIVEAHGGTIRAQNRAGGGASFVFTIPRKAQPHE